MAKEKSHTHVFQSTLSTRRGARLTTLSDKARTRAAILRRLAASLELHDPSDVDGDARIGAVAEAALNGTQHHTLDADELDFLGRIDALALVAGEPRQG